MSTPSYMHERADSAARLGSLVRARRRDLRLRQSELADLAGVSERFVHAVENGKLTIQIDKLVDLLDAVGLHLQVVRGGASWITTEHADGPTAST